MTATSKEKKTQRVDSVLVDHGYGTRFQKFQYLMRQRIRDVLIVSSPYDLYVFEDDGRLYEMIRNNYQHLNLSHVPEFTRVSSGVEAIDLLKEVGRFDLIITTMHIEGMSPFAFVRRIQEESIQIPIVLLSFDGTELSNLASEELSRFDQAFMWLGDYRLILAIIKSLEDRLNVENDTRQVGVNSIILIEDNIRDYSAFLPLVYTEIMKQSQHLLSDEIGISQKKIRQRARPKIILCCNYEQAWRHFQQYKENILAIISDVEFCIRGELDSRAGFKFGRAVKEHSPELPIFFLSSLPENRPEALEIGDYFVVKEPSVAAAELRRFMADSLGFGDFVFRMPDGKEVGRARDLNSLERKLATVPDECFVYHAGRNHFSRWLKARTEFWLADQLRPRKVSDFSSVRETREHLIAAIRIHRSIRQRGIITAFKKEEFDPGSSFSRIGTGSLGGKARGLSFVNVLINNYKLQDRFEGIRIYIPVAVVIGTDVFDRFLQGNHLHDFAIACENDEEIIARFLAAEHFPDEILDQLREFLGMINSPLAVRSSSLLEDSHSHPFAGVYRTYMLSNSQAEPENRLAQVVRAVKRVYASTFFTSAKQYFRMTPYRIQDEKMAVIIQKLVGSVHANRYYPTFSGVARSYNFYPVAPQQYGDGIVSLAHGLGKMVVEGGPTVRFCPKYPNHIEQLSTPSLALESNQHAFYAVELDPQESITQEKVEDNYVKEYPLSEAEKDGTLTYTASTYSPDNDRIVDGISGPGIRLVTFAPILKHRSFPLTAILEILLDMGKWGMGTPVEIEFSVNLSPAPGQPQEFSLLQMRPMVLHRELEALNIMEAERESILCQTDQILGDGVLKNITDIIVVDRDRFDRSQSHVVVGEISRLNTTLVQAGRRYLLIGMGRWGSLDPWLGIPVTWDEINGAGAIIESGFENFNVTPSQGSHFFHNLVSFSIGYFTVRPRHDQSFIDWDWLRQQPALQEFKFTRHIRVSAPLLIQMSGRLNKGLILKPA